MSAPEPLISRHVREVLSDPLVERELRGKLAYLDQQLARADRDTLDRRRLTTQRRDLLRHARGAGEPVRLDEVRVALNPDTGEFGGWHGLNTNPDRCPLTACDGCGAKCQCAPCACPRCQARHTATTGQPAAADREPTQLGLPLAESSGGTR